MNLPRRIKEVSLTDNSYWIGIYPPLGFVEFKEANDGAGNSYGLYWQIGKEDQEPIVCQMNHEEFSLVPEFPDLDSFLTAVENDDLTFRYIDGLNNLTFFPIPYKKAKVLAKNGKTVEAIERLTISINLFSEYADSWTLLSELHRKNDDIKQAEWSALNAIRSNWTFGLPSKKAIESFAAIDPNGSYKEDPLVKRKSGLFTAGDLHRPLTIDPNQLEQAISEYKNAGDIRSYILLKQNYGYWMHLQNEEIQKEHDFDPESWKNSFITECIDLLPERKIKINRG